MPTYVHADVSNWHGRVDGHAPGMLRWHQHILCADLMTDGLPPLKERQRGIALLGFCCDEGVRRNGGRPGAAHGPQRLRQACCNLPLAGTDVMLVDAGDVVADDHDLEAAQQLLGNTVQRVRSQGYLPIVLGGGHEVAWGNFSGIVEQVKNKTVGVINFDAHFDLRPFVSDGKAHSGSPFFQMSQYCREHHAIFQYLVFGIQPYSNTQWLFEKAAEIGTTWFCAEDFIHDNQERMADALNHVLKNADVLHLSVDMDVFAAAYAPAVSAPAYSGIVPQKLFRKMLRHIALSNKLATVDIAELNPLFDVDMRTAKLAATIVYDIVHASMVNADYPY